MIEFTFDTSALEKLQAAMTAAPDIFEKEFTEAANEVGEIWYQDLSKYAPEPSYPISWDSALQRRSFFAKKTRTTTGVGFGFGVPHVRTGRLPDSWQQEITTKPTMINLKVYSTYERAKFIQGSYEQSNIHDGRWLTVEDEYMKTRTQVHERFIEASETAIQRITNGLK